MATSLHRSRNFLTCAAILLSLTPFAHAHVGTANVFIQGKAGPYPVYVTVTPPVVIPGQATVSVLWSPSPSGADVTSVLAEANILSAVQSGQMPQGLKLQPGPAGSHEFHGTVWIMSQGSWQVGLQASGPAGTGTIAVPLPASPLHIMGMSRSFGAMLLILGAILIAGFCAIAAALVREAQQEPGTEPDAPQRALGRRAALISAALIVLLLLAWYHLWRQQVARYTTLIYKPLTMETSLGPDNVLHLRLQTPGILAQTIWQRRLDDLVLDHNHLMHLYLLRWPAMDVAFHLHPDQVAPGAFDLPLPSMPPGDYRLFADIVHADGFPETAVANLHLAPINGRPLTGDDATGNLPPLPAAPTPTDILLPDGYRFHFAIQQPNGATLPPAALAANAPTLLRFTLLDPRGNPPPDMENYMGMIGHLAVLKTDGSVFAHIHPDGSAAMAAYMLANAPAPSTPANAMPGMDMAAMSDTPANLPNIARFPFGFPTPGAYRLIVQMKHGSTVETAAADITVH